MKETVRTYVYKNFIGKGPEPTDSQSLFQSGIIDSLGHLRLISFLEREFDITLSRADLSWENFDSIEKIVALVQSQNGKRV